MKKNTSSWLVSFASHTRLAGCQISRNNKPSIPRIGFQIDGSIIRGLLKRVGVVVTHQYRGGPPLYRPDRHSNGHVGGWWSVRDRFCGQFECHRWSGIVEACCRKFSVRLMGSQAPPGLMDVHCLHFAQVSPPRRLALKIEVGAMAV